MDILVVDDEPNIRKVMELIINDLGYNTYKAENPVEAKKILKKEKVDLIILDIKMPKMDGIQFLKILNVNYKDIPVIMLTAHGNISIAVNTIKIGAFDFIEKGADEDIIKEKIEKALLEKKQIKNNYEVNMVVNSSKMKNLLKKARTVANKDVNVLIKGESGVGKEKLAKYIYKIANNRYKDFIAVNCGAIPDELFESEMFGYEKGAFTGSENKHKGKIEKANNGILFLDEIGELSKENQVALLRVIENKEFFRLGGSKKIKSDFKLISATNQSLEKKVRNNSFRKDLYFRINVYEFNIPPLRNRKKDILPLAYYFINQFCEKYKLENKEIHPELKKFLKNNYWKGNIRELKNFIERLLIFSDEKYLYFNEDYLGDTNINLDKILREDEIEILNRAYELTNGNKEKMCKILNINKKDLDERLNKYEIFG